MKIECTIREFGNMVRDCQNGYCPQCVFRSVCNNDGKDGKALIEDCVEFTISDGKEES